MKSKKYDNIAWYFFLVLFLFSIFGYVFKFSKMAGVNIEIVHLGYVRDNQ